ncbi:MAG: ABC transporter ATP-binding protein [Acidimicrobiales bacterium]
MTATAPRPDVEPRTWTVAFRVARFYPVRYIGGGSLWALNHSLPLITGLLVKALFDRIADGSAAGDGALGLIVAVALAEVVNTSVLAGGFIAWPAWWHTVFALIRTNLLGSILEDDVPPSVRLPGSSAEALGRFREDVADLVWFVDIWVDVAGGVVFTVAALAVMGSIDVRMTIAVALPLVAVVVLTRLLAARIRRLHGATRESGAKVSSLVGELFANVLAVKAGGAQERMLGRLAEENQRRRHAAVRVEVVANLIPTASRTASALTIGVVLLLAADRMRRGDFGVGDLALFTIYADALTTLPRFVGRMLARHREAGVSIQRMTKLLTDPDPLGLVADRPVHVRKPAPEPQAPTPAIERLDRLEVRGLTVRHPSSGRGVFDVDLDVAGRSFTVVTGAVGAGKTTLVRALVGGLPVEAGSIDWNGEPVDLATGLVAPRVGYAGQIPRLFSAPLGENLTFGWPATSDDVDEALRVVALDADVAGFPHGLDTIVGPRGARLSGGQQQRTATARALLRNPGLLVIDDPSSALDVETESRLWSNLLAGPITVLAVSHRRAALERADTIVVLDRGRVVGHGSLTDLLSTCPEMRRLWREELVVEGEELL